MANFASLAYTPAQVYLTALDFAKGKTLEDFIPEGQVVIGFRPPLKGEWHLNTFGLPTLTEIDGIWEPRLILGDRPKSGTLKPGTAERLLLSLAEGYSLSSIPKAWLAGSSAAEAKRYLETLAAKEAQCEKK